MSIHEIAQFLEENGCKLKGCSRKEIEKLQITFGVKLPLSYVDFLLYMGKGAGKFMLGSSVFYDEIFDLKNGSIELLKENHFRLLPNDAYVFWMHQGYQFAFFIVNDEDNPPVYFYYEGRSKDDFEKKEDTFTNFLEKQIIMSGFSNLHTT